MKKKFYFSLGFKFILIISLVILFTSIVSVWFFITTQSIISKSFIEKRVFSLANTLAVSGEYAVNTLNKEFLNSLIKNTVKEEDVVYSIIYDVNGKQLVSNVMADKYIEQYISSTPINNKVIENLERKRLQQNVSNIKNIGNIVDIIVPILSQGETFDSNKETVVGAFRIGFDLEKIDYLMLKMKRSVFVLTFVVTIVGVIVSYFLVKVVLRPIKELMIGTKKIAAGFLNYRVPLNSNDEFRRLAISFNSMAVDMETQIQELNKEKKELLNLKVAFEQRSQELEETLNKIKNIQQELIKAEKFATVGRLSSSVAHELRNPLAAIKNISYFLLKMKSFNDEKTKQMVEMLSSEVLRANKIITELLDYSRIKKLAKLSVDIETFIDRVVKMVPLQENIKLTKKIENFNIEFDPDKITQVLINLISNAKDAMPPEGGEITISAKKTDTTGQILIQDNACGMSEDTVAHLFEPLFTTKLKGIGLGLPIVKEIIDAHQGKISVTSKENIGTIFTIELPLK